MTTIKVDPTLDFAGNVTKLKEQLDLDYDKYYQQRDGEQWVGYNTEEAQMEDGWRLGYIAALEDVLHVMGGGTEWRQLLTEEEEQPAQPAAQVHFCSNDEHPIRLASHVVLDSDGDPYRYLCPACVGGFEDGQEVFDLVIEPLDEAKKAVEAQVKKETAAGEAVATRSAAMVVQVHRVYKLSVDVPAHYTPSEAERYTYNLGSLTIADQGNLENVEVDWPEFQAWEDEDGTETPGGTEAA